MGKYILSIDQSTSGSKAILIDDNGKIVDKRFKEHTQYYPKSGWVEHDPMEIYVNVNMIVGEILKANFVNKSDLYCISITNQRETVMVWDKNTGKPIYNAIVWQCRRTADMCEKLKKDGIEEIVKLKTGLLLDPYFSATKVKWILDNVPLAYENAISGNLIMGTVDSFLIWKMTGGKEHVTDYTNASRTMLLDIKRLMWDDELLEIFNIPATMVPKIKSSNDLFGYTSKEHFEIGDIPICGVIGDSQAALFAQKCFSKGAVKATYGTGSSILMNIGDQYVEPHKGLVTSLAWVINSKPTYAIEGIIHCSADSLKWLKDNIGLIKDFDEIEEEIKNIKSNEGVYLVPALVGLGIPYWQPNARALFSGMTRGTVKGHLLRAALESIAYQVKDALDLMEVETDITSRKLRVDGGPTKNAFLMQFQSDIINKNLEVSQYAELSSLGAAYMGGIGKGVWKDISSIESLVDEKTSYYPNMDENTRNENYLGWQSAVKKVLS